MEPNAEEILVAAEQQELQKRRQAARFLVNFPLSLSFHSHLFFQSSRKNINPCKKNVQNPILWNYSIHQQ